jgi:radical SAM-linked protein
MRIVIKFMKTGRAAYMSHLDLQRTLLRSLRRVGLNPAYSSGFNPHPKLSLVLPLTLGFESLCEYLEATIEGEPVIEVDELNRVLPEGIVVISAAAVRDPATSPGEATGSGADAARSRSMASRVRYAEYDIAAPLLPAGAAAAEVIAEYLAQSRIIIEKENRKKGRTDSVDIRPLIESFAKARNAGDRARDTCVLSASAGATLNPLALVKSFYAYCGGEADPAEVTITRTKIIFAD